MALSTVYDGVGAILCSFFTFSEDSPGLSHGDWLGFRMEILSFHAESLGVRWGVTCEKPTLELLSGRSLSDDSVY
jgi:hypothetical protein